MSPLWRIKEVDSVDLQIVKEASIPGLIWRILNSRRATSLGTKTQNLSYQDFSQGLNPVWLQEFLYPKLSSLKDPSTIFGMDVATQRISQGFLNNEKICIYADFDLDGTSGLALLKTGLEKIGFKNLVYYQPKRLSEGYGFHANCVDELKNQGVSLIVTVDVGITSNKACQRAKELGIDVIITDHHLPSEILPEALVILNPNQSQCHSGLGYLCGAGVAFYLLRSIKKYFFEHIDYPKNPFDLKDVLDFFAIATLTDMVPLVEDNRVLVKHGLLKIAQTDKPGLMALLRALELSGRPLSAQDVAIRFAPKLNALSRMEAGVLPIDVMLIQDEIHAAQIVSEVLQQNSQRVQFQNEAEAEALAALKTWTNEDFVFVASKNFHRGVVGLIATKLAQVFNRPAFVGSVGADGMVVGSSRLPPGHESSLVEALSAGAGALSRFGGHAAAAGFELFSSKTDLFLEGLNAHYSELRSAPRPLELEYDTEAELTEIDATAMKWHDFIGPFGAGFPIPLIRLKHLQLVTKRELKGGHLKLAITNSDESQVIDALFFSPSESQKSE